MAGPAANPNPAPPSSPFHPLSSLSHPLGYCQVPVFFDVEPRDVRHQTAPFEPAFLEHEKNTELNEETVNGWRGALRKAGELCGYELQYEANGS
ncbi:hypothetical protein EJ110_NYTH06591 [Nymphaea thermarum]|nr:hypothetical protein EJ110_NYTH06591 [Nymphaea thermarum]